MQSVGLEAIPEALRPWLFVAIGVQLVLQAIAFVRLLRMPEERVAFGKKWVWVLIILFGESIGAILFFVLGRKPAAATDPLAGQQAAAGDRATRAADVLYGDREDGAR